MQGWQNQTFVIYGRLQMDIDETKMVKKDVLKGYFHSTLKSKE